MPDRRGARHQRQQRAVAGPPVRGERRERVRPGPDHVGVQRDDRPRAEQRQRPLQPAAGLQQLRLVGDQHVGRDPGEMRVHLLGVGVGVDDDPADPGLAHQRQRVVDQRPPADREQRLRPVAGQRAHPGAEPGGEDHRGGGRGASSAARGSDAGDHRRLGRRQVPLDQAARAGRAPGASGRRRDSPRPAADGRGSAACRRGGPAARRGRRSSGCAAPRARAPPRPALRPRRRCASR